MVASAADGKGSPPGGVYFQLREATSSELPRGNIEKQFVAPGSNTVSHFSLPTKDTLDALSIVFS